MLWWYWLNHFIKSDRNTNHKLTSNLSTTKFYMISCWRNIQWNEKNKKTVKRSSLSVKNIRNNLFVKYNLKLIWIKFTLISYKQMNMNDSFQSPVSKILQRSIKHMVSDILSFKYSNRR